MNMPHGQGLDVITFVVEQARVIVEMPAIVGQARTVDVHDDTRQKPSSKGSASRVRPGDEQLTPAWQIAHVSEADHSSVPGSALVLCCR